MVNCKGTCCYNKDSRSKSEKIWAFLVHLSFNMWLDREIPEQELDECREYIFNYETNTNRNRPEFETRVTKLWMGGAKPYMRFDMPVWEEFLKRAADKGVNMVVIDLGDAVKYQSHPEIAVKDAWSTNKLKSELDKIRSMGIEPIPKLNFSTNHHTWLGKYTRYVSSDIYYQVCKDLISEVMELFDKPRFFHIGMDEESASHKYSMHVVQRQYDLWWHDLYFFANEIEKHNARAWVWSDAILHNSEEFLQKMPRSVVQSNWYYSSLFTENVKTFKAYSELQRCGFDQIPAGSNWECSHNLEKLMETTSQIIDPQHLFGYMQTTWLPVIDEWKDMLFEAVDIIGNVRKKHLESSC